MIIGVPKEGKLAERRIAITPEGTKQLTDLGHTVLIETCAGQLSGFNDEQYTAAGAIIKSANSQVWEECELLVKVKEPTATECEYFRPGLAIFSFLHLAALPNLADKLLQHRVIGIDYDLLRAADGSLCILQPMSIIAGKLAVQCGAYALQASNGGLGILLGGTPNVPAARVLVIGIGSAGFNAALVANGMGAKVIALDINESSLVNLKNQAPEISTRISNSEVLSEELALADLVIGAVLIPGALAPKLITRAHLKTMKPGATIVDICIDQGGIAETSRPTSILEPTYLEEGVVHYAVPNMPALVPQTSTKALTKASLPWIIKIAESGIHSAINESSPIRNSVITLNGHLTNSVIASDLKLKHQPIENLLS